MSASTGMISSLKASFIPSASDCNVPHGPTRFGPIRFCIRPTTLRSNTIENSVMTTRNTKTPITLMRTNQIGSSPNPGRFWVAASTLIAYLLPRRSPAAPVSWSAAPRARPGAEDAPHAVHRARSWHPHDPVRHLGDLTPARRACRGRSLPAMRVAGARADLGGRCRTDQRTRRLGGAGQVLVAVLHAAGVDAARARWPAAPARPRARHRSRRHGRARPARRPGTASRQQSRHGSPRHRRQAQRTSSSSARASRTRASDIAPVLVRVRSNGRRRPSQAT